VKTIVVGMHEAKTTLSQLVSKARAGQEIVITNNGRHVAKLVGLSHDGVDRRPGRLAGKIEIKPGFDELPAGFETFAE
jgi:prevent-host-death family protein